MLGLLTTIHVLVAVILILIILLQSARGTDIAGAFGGMGSQAAFGPRGTTTFLTKATTVLAVIFMLTSISLAILANRDRGGGDSVLSEETATQSQPVEGQPEAEAETPPGGAQPSLPVRVEMTPAAEGQPAPPVNVEIEPPSETPSQ